MTHTMPSPDSALKDFFRDNIRRAKLGYLVILGIEDQSKVHYSMPVRKMLYDALGYSSELSAIGNTDSYCCILHR